MPWWSDFERKLAVFESGRLWTFSFFDVALVCCLATMDLDFGTCCCVGEVAFVCCLVMIDLGMGRGESLLKR